MQPIQVEVLGGGAWWQDAPAVALMVGAAGLIFNWWVKRREVLDRRADTKAAVAARLIQFADVFTELERDVEEVDERGRSLDLRIRSLSVKVGNGSGARQDVALLEAELEQVKQASEPVQAALLALGEKTRETRRNMGVPAFECELWLSRPTARFFGFIPEEWYMSVNDPVGRFSGLAVREVRATRRGWLFLAYFLIKATWITRRYRRAMVKRQREDCPTTRYASLVSGKPIKDGGK